VIDAHEDVYELLLAAAAQYVRWSVEHPAYTQLMAWRPVPGYTPSAEAYAAALEMWAEALDLLTALQVDGRLRSDVAPDHLLSAWSVLVSGVISQQLANAPDETFADGRYTGLLPEMVSMFAREYGGSRRKSRSTKGRRTP
jgi:hypothetical protein